MNIGEKILSLRKSNGLSQEQLAAKLTVSRQSVSKWELGEAIPDTENVAQLCKLFAVSADYLIHDTYESDMDIPAVKHSEQHLRKHFRHMALKIAGFMTACIGLIGNATLWILSTMMDVPLMKTYINPDGTVVFYGGGDVRGYAFIPFIQHYRLYALWGVCIILLLAGITILIWVYRNKEPIWRDKGQNTRRR